MPTVARSIGARWEVSRKRTLSGAAGEFLAQAQDLIAAFAMRDTVAGWRFYRRAKEVAFAIERGELTGADLAFMGETVTFTA